LDYLLTHTSLSPIRRVFAPSFLTCKKGCTRLAAASDKVCQLLVHGQWFFPGTPASSTPNTGRHDIAEILLKVALNTKIISNVKIINFKNFFKYQIAIIVQLRTAGQMSFSMDFVLAIQHSILGHNRLPLIHPCPSNYIYMQNN